MPGNNGATPLKLYICPCIHTCICTYVRRYVRIAYTHIVPAQEKYKHHNNMYMYVHVRTYVYAYTCTICTYTIAVCILQLSVYQKAQTNLDNSVDTDSGVEGGVPMSSSCKDSLVNGFLVTHNVIEHMIRKLTARSYVRMCTLCATYIRTYICCCES